MSCRLHDRNFKIFVVMLDSEVEICWKSRLFHYIFLSFKYFLRTRYNYYFYESLLTWLVYASCLILEPRHYPVTDWTLNVYLSLSIEIGFYFSCDLIWFNYYFFTIKFFFYFFILPFFLKTPEIIFFVMQKPFKKCVFPMRVNRFLHIRKKLIRRFQKKRQYNT